MQGMGQVGVGKLVEVVSKICYKVVLNFVTYFEVCYRFEDTEFFPKLF